MSFFHSLKPTSVILCKYFQLLRWNIMTSSYIPKYLYRRTFFCIMLLARTVYTIMIKMTISIVIYIFFAFTPTTQHPFRHKNIKILFFVSQVWVFSNPLNCRVLRYKIKPRLYSIYFKWHYKYVKTLHLEEKKTIVLQFCIEM